MRSHSRRKECFEMFVKKTSACCLFMFLTLIGGPVLAAPTKAQSNEKAFVGASGALTLASNVTTGNLLTVQIAQWDANGGHRTATVSDNLGNSYVLAARQVGTAASGENCIEEWYAKNA